MRLFVSKCLPFILVLIFFFPATGHAETVLSQSFPEPFVYFDLGGSHEYIYSDRAIYTVTNPSTSQVWSYTGTTVSDVGYDYDFSSYSGTTYNEYSYIGVETAEYDGESLLWRNQEIWRFGEDENGLLVESVLAIPESSSFMRFKNIFTYKQALYALRENGDLWKTRNGTSWFQVSTVNFPEDTDNFVVATTADKIYLGGMSDSTSTATFYRSKRGTTWHEMAGDYQVSLETDSSTELGIRDLSILNDKLYVIVKSGDDTESVWYKSFETGDWDNPIATDRQIHAIDPLRNYLNIFYYGDDSKYVDKCSPEITSCSRVFLSDDFTNEDTSIVDFLTHVRNRSIYLFRDPDDFFSYYLGRL